MQDYSKTDKFPIDNILSAVLAQDEVILRERAVPNNVHAF